MRIALVHYSAPPTVGGVERVIEQQADVLARHGHKVIVVSATKGAKVDGAIMEYAPNFYVKRVRSALAGCEVVIVHNMFTMPFNWEASQMFASLRQEMTGTRFINWVHDVDVAQEAFAGLQLKAVHIAVSESRKSEFCTKLGIKATQCQVIPNGVDAAKTLGLGVGAAAFANKHRLLERELVLFHPARLLARKNIELSIEVTAALQKQGLDAACVITGAADPHRLESAEYADKMRALAVKKKMEAHVLFAGGAFEIGEDDVRAFYSLADALIFPSKAEGFGLPVLEATLHRLPAFCSDIPAHRELAGTGVVFFKLTEKADDLANQIVKHLKKDKAIARKRWVLRQFGWERIYKECLEPLLK
ncbi:MAG: glycosyltransferase family 4 protein [Verrucomicrobiaceae bacterium]